MSTFTDTRTYSIINCPECHVDFGIPARWDQDLRESHATFYCPAGHPMSFTGRTTAQQLEDAKARERHLADQLQAAEAEAEQHRRQLVRDRHRIANGVCPCCNRSFTALRRHMATQHPDYDPGPAVDRPKCSCGARFDTYRGLRIHQGLVGQDLTAKYPWRRHATVVA